MVWSVYCALTNSPVTPGVLNQLILIFITPAFGDRKKFGI